MRQRLPLIRLGQKMLTFKKAPIVSKELPFIPVGPEFFASRSDLETIAFEYGCILTRISQSLFANSTIRSIRIPNSVKVIEDSAFMNCQLLSFVAFDPESQLESIGAYVFSEAFSKGSNISMSLPCSLENMGQSVFLRCHAEFLSISLTKKSLLRTLSPASFRSAPIRFFYVPDSVVEIGTQCFKDSLLSEVVFGETCLVHTFGREAFAGTKLTSIEVPTSVTKIDAYCFSECRSLRRFSVGMNSNITFIGSKAFFGTAISELLLPPKLDVLDRFAFSGCFFTVHGTSKFYYASSGFVLGRDGTLIYANTLQPQVSIPSVVTHIADACFEGKQTLETVDLMSVTSIGENAFLRSSLKSIRIPSCVLVLENGCFEFCHALQDVNFDTGSQLTKLPARCFKDSALTQIVIPASVQVISTSCFERCVSLLSVKVEPSSSLRKLKRRAFADCRVLSKFDLPPTVETVKSMCFSGCNLLTLSLPSTAHVSKSVYYRPA